MLGLMTNPYSKPRLHHRQYCDASFWANVLGTQIVTSKSFSSVSVKLHSIFLNLNIRSAYQQGAKRCRAQPATLRSYPIQDVVPERPEPSEARALSFSVLELRGLRQEHQGLYNDEFSSGYALKGV